jgi:hypothetical protein
MSDFDYTTFSRYIVRTSVHLPFGQIVKGTVVEFNGNIVRVNGREESLPTFMGAITCGWAIPYSESVETSNEAAIQIPATVAANLAPSKMTVTDSSETVVREGFDRSVSTNNISQRSSLPVSKDFSNVGGLENIRASSSANRVMQDPVAKVASSTPMQNPTATVGSGRVFTPKVVQSYEDSVSETSFSRPVSGQVSPSPENAPNEGVRLLGSPKTKILVDDSTKVEWDTNAHWKQRVQKALAYKDSDPDRFNRIINVETDKVRAILTSENPEAATLGAESPAANRISESSEDNVVVKMPRKIAKAKSDPIIA